MALTEKQKQFVAEYLIDLNATQAAIRAGYSKKTADRIGPELLGKTCVSNALKVAMDERARRVEVTQDMVAEELRKIGFADAADYNDTKLKYGNKLKALELLGKHLGMFDGKPPAARQENNLLEAIADSVGEDMETDDLPEIQ